jgi:hypothetical protein
MTSKSTTDGVRYIEVEATKLLIEETTAPKGVFYGLKVDPNASFEAIEALLKLAGRAADLNKIRVAAMHKYGKDVLWS